MSYEQPTFKTTTEKMLWLRKSIASIENQLQMELSKDEKRPDYTQWTHRSNFALSNLKIELQQIEYDQETARIKLAQDQIEAAKESDRVKLECHKLTLEHKQSQLVAELAVHRAFADAIGKLVYSEDAEPVSDRIVHIYDALQDGIDDIRNDFNTGE